jgi:Na+(H+)/acetate symporter ActP
LLLLGIWWRGLTARGAAAGVLTGGVACPASIGYSVVGVVSAGWLGVLLYRPAAVTVPLAFVVMVVVSRWFSAGIPPGTDAVMLRLHAPERLGLQSRPVGRRPYPT